MLNKPKIKKLSTEVDSSSNQFLEKVLPLSALLLAIPIIAKADNKFLYLGLFILHTFTNVTLSKMAKKVTEPCNCYIEHLKLGFNVLFASFIPILFEAYTPIWLLNVLAIFRVPMTYPNRRTCVFALSALSFSPLTISLYTTELSSDIILAVSTLISISLLSSSILLHLQKKNKTLAQSRAQSLASAKMASVGEMAGNIAHEINTPLGTILLHTQLGERAFSKVESIEELQPMIVQRLQSIAKTTEKISQIISSLKDISRDTSQGEALSKITLQEFLDDLLNLCQERALSQRIKLDIKINEKDKNQHLLLPKVQLSQIVLNLLNNAFDAIEEDPSDEKWVTLSLSIQNKTVIIKTKNSGSKIPDQIQEQMFLPFFTTKDIGKGTGLGLSLSKSMVESNGGTLYLHKESQNTCFVIELPYKKAS